MITNLIYIGTSVEIKRRLKYHKNCLEEGIHPNLHMQRSFLTYGKNNFNYGTV